MTEKDSPVSPIKDPVPPVVDANMHDTEVPTGGSTIADQDAVEAIMDQESDHMETEEVVASAQLTPVSH